MDDIVNGRVKICQEKFKKLKIAAGSASGGESKKLGSIFCQITRFIHSIPVQSGNADF
jgi:hypothetical protein